MTRPPPTMDVITGCPCHKMDHVKGNLGGVLSGSFRVLDQSLFLRLRSYSAK